MGRLLETIDEWATDNGMDAKVGTPQRYPATQVENAPPLDIDLSYDAIKSVVWATGFRPDYSWLEVPVLDRKGSIRHDGGVVDSPGMYVMGLTFLRRRKSSFIHGAGDDTQDLSTYLVAYLDEQGRIKEPANVNCFG